jgi:hypothetical protein
VRSNRMCLDYAGIAGEWLRQVVTAKTTLNRILGPLAAEVARAESCPLPDCSLLCGLLMQPQRKGRDVNQPIIPSSELQKLYGLALAGIDNGFGTFWRDCSVSFVVF